MKLSMQSLAPFFSNYFTCSSSPAPLIPATTSLTPARPTDMPIYPSSLITALTTPGLTSPTSISTALTTPGITSPPSCNPATPTSITPPPPICPSLNKQKLLSVQEVLIKYRKHVNVCTAGRQTCRLARYAFFGEDVMKECTPLGARNRPGLPQEELRHHKKLFLTVFHTSIEIQWILNPYGKSVCTPVTHRTNYNKSQ